MAENKEVNQIQRMGFLAAFLLKSENAETDTKSESQGPNEKFKGGCIELGQGETVSTVAGHRWPSLEDSMQVKAARHKRPQSIGFVLHEILRIGEFVETESSIVVARARWAGDAFTG